MSRPDPVLGGENAYLLLFSAHSAVSLQTSIAAHQAYVDQGYASLQDVAYTLANRRSHHTYRAYAVTDDQTSWNVSTAEAATLPPRIVWVFTGQGAQWPQMGAELLEVNATFRDTIQKLDRFLRTLPSPPPWTIEGEKHAPRLNLDQGSC